MFSNACLNLCLCICVGCNSGPLSEEKENKICDKKVANARRKNSLKKGPMLPATRDILQQFFHPFNQRLADVLQDRAFLWTFNTTESLSPAVSAVSEKYTDAAIRISGTK